MKPTLWTLALTGSMSVLSSPAGQDRVTEATALVDVTALAVQMDGTVTQIEGSDLDTAALKAGLETRLRDAGLEVLAIETLRDLEVPGTKRSKAGVTAPGRPVLHVRLDAVPVSGTDLYAYWIRVTLDQDVYLAREVDRRRIWVSTVTWRGTERSGVVGEAYVVSLEDDVLDSLDEFVAAHRAANPPRLR